MPAAPTLLSARRGKPRIPRRTVPTGGLQGSGRRRHARSACLRHPPSCPLGEASRGSPVGPRPQVVFRVVADAGMQKTHACGTRPPVRSARQAEDPPSDRAHRWSSGLWQTQACKERGPAAPALLSARRGKPRNPRRTVPTGGLQGSGRRRHARSACLRHPPSCPLGEAS